MGKQIRDIFGRKIDKCPICGKLISMVGHEKWVYVKDGIKYCSWKCYRTKRK